MVKATTLKQLYTSLKKKKPRKPKKKVAYTWDCPDGQTFHLVLPDLLRGDSAYPYASIKEARKAMISFVQDFAKDEGWSKATALSYLAEMRIYKITLTVEELQ
jgi:hypothetical protein